MTKNRSLWYTCSVGGEKLVGFGLGIVQFPGHVRLILRIYYSAMDESTEGL